MKLKFEDPEDRDEDKKIEDKSKKFRGVPKPTISRGKAADNAVGADTETIDSEIKNLALEKAVADSAENEKTTFAIQELVNEGNIEGAKRALDKLENVYNQNEQLIEQLEKEIQEFKGKIFLTDYEHLQNKKKEKVEKSLELANQIEKTREMIENATPPDSKLN